MCASPLDLVRTNHLAGTTTLEMMPKFSTKCRGEKLTQPTLKYSFVPKRPLSLPIFEWRLPISSIALPPIQTRASSSLPLQSLKVTKSLLYTPYHLDYSLPLRFRILFCAAARLPHTLHLKVKGNLSRKQNIRIY